MSSSVQPEGGVGITHILLCLHSILCTNTEAIITICAGSIFHLSPANFTVKTAGRRADCSPALQFAFSLSCGFKSRSPVCLCQSVSFSVNMLKGSWRSAGESVFTG